MSDTLKTLEQKTVLFYDDELIAIRADDQQVYVSLRHLCDALGLNRPTQVRKIRNHDILSDGYKGGVIMTPPSADGRGGGTQKSGLLRADMIPLWLTTITVSRVREDLRPKIKQYQREAMQVLWEAFRSGRLTTAIPIDELLNKDTPAVQAYKIAKAVADLALNQVLLESRIDNHATRIEAIEAILGDPQRLISAEQAMHISQAVKTIALEMGKRSGRNEFQGVYGELYRRFKIPSYRELPAQQYDPAMNFLRDWYSSVIGGDVPF